MASMVPGCGKAIAELVPRRFVRDLLPQLQALRDALPAELKPRR